MISFQLRGSFDNTNKFFGGSKILPERWRSIMEKYGQKGLDALEKATPKDTGQTAAKWSYRVTRKGLLFENSNMVNGIPVVILIQYGHALKQGGYVQPNDFINPALRPIFDQLAEECWKEVTGL